jgi:hypothetical protein
MRLSMHALPESVPNGFDFRRGQRRRYPAEANQADHARYLDDLHPIPQQDPNKQISWKKRQLHLESAILPFPYRFIEREEVVDGPAQQLFRHCLFMA